MPMDAVDTTHSTEFQRALSAQIALYETDLDGLRSTGGEPEEISTFERIVGELRRLQVEDLAEIARAATWRTAQT